jgi:predicted Zn-dependent peptidase
VAHHHAEGAGSVAVSYNPQSATLANGLTLLLNERRGLPVVAASVVLRTGSDMQSLDEPGLANFVSACSTKAGRREMRCSLRIKWHSLARGDRRGTMDATTIAGRSLSKNFGALLDRSPTSRCIRRFRGRNRPAAGAA